MSFLSVALNTQRGSISAIRLLDRKFYTASAYLQVSTTELGMW